MHKMASDIYQLNRNKSIKGKEIIYANYEMSKLVSVLYC